MLKGLVYVRTVRKRLTATPVSYRVGGQQTPTSELDRDTHKYQVHIKTYVNLSLGTSERYQIDAKLKSLQSSLSNIFTQHFVYKANYSSDTSNHVNSD